MRGALLEALHTPAFGVLIAAALQEWRAWKRGRRADRERREFREELAAWTVQDPNNHTKE